MEHEANTLQPTALVHEAWLRLGLDEQPQWLNRAHFFAAAAESMRRILVDSARRKLRVRHSVELEKVSARATGFDVANSELDDGEIVLLNDALERLSEHDARKAELVKHRYFVGLTLPDCRVDGDFRTHGETRLGLRPHLVIWRDKEVSVNDVIQYGSR